MLKSDFATNPALEECQPLMDDIGIVIVNYNTRDYLRRCLQTVFGSQGHISFSVCVVDNASNDGSMAMVEEEFPQCIRLQAEENLGYPRANNLGLRHFGFDLPADAANDTPRYALLLNPDTELPPDALTRMVDYLDEHPEAGVAGPYLELPDGTMDLACRRSFPTVEVSFWRMTGLGRLFPRSPRFGRYNLTYLPADQPAEVDSVVGAFMMVRREAIRQAGLLDETFFMYGEDLDWSFRIKEAGWKVLYNPAVKVLHVKRAASRHSGRARIEFYRAMRIFYQKHYAASTPFIFHILTIGCIMLLEKITCLRLLIKRLLAGKRAEAAQ